jgi:hypothetical protein
MTEPLSLPELEGHFYRLKAEHAELEQSLEAITAQLMPVWSARKEIKADIIRTYDLGPRGLPLPKSGDARARAALIARLDEINADPRTLALTREHRIVQKTVEIWKREIAKVETAISREVKRALKQEASKA